MICAFRSIQFIHYIIKIKSMEVGNRSARNTAHRLTSTKISKPETETEGSPRLQRDNTGSSWVANLQSIKTPQMSHRQIMDFDRLISISGVQKVGSVPFLQSRIFEHSRPLTDRHHTNSLQTQFIQKLYSPQKPISQQEQSTKCCCNIFQRKVIKPSSKIVEPPKRLKRPNLNELVVEKRRIKIVIPEDFNQRRKLTMSQEILNTPTNFSSPQSTYRYF